MDDKLTSEELKRMRKDRALGYQPAIGPILPSGDAVPCPRCARGAVMHNSDEPCVSCSLKASRVRIVNLEASCAELREGLGKTGGCVLSSTHRMVCPNLGPARDLLAVNPAGAKLLEEMKAKDAKIAELEEYNERRMDEAQAKLSSMERDRNLSQEEGARDGLRAEKAEAALAALQEGLEAITEHDEDGNVPFVNGQYGIETLSGYCSAARLAKHLLSSNPACSKLLEVAQAAEIEGTREVERDGKPWKAFHPSCRVVEKNMCLRALEDARERRRCAVREWRGLPNESVSKDTG